MRGTQPLIAVFKDGRKDQEPREADGHCTLCAGGTFSFLGLQERNSSVDTLVFAYWDLYETCDLRSLSLCVFKLLSLGTLGTFWQ